MFAAILSTLKLLMFVFCLGVSLCFIVFVPLIIYLAPYDIWLGTSKAKRLYPKLQDNKSLWLSVKRATKLYKSWIIRKEPTF